MHLCFRDKKKKKWISSSVFFALLLAFVGVSRLECKIVEENMLRVHAA